MTRTPDDDRAPVMAGAEPFTADGAPDVPHGALVLHGFTGNPHSVKGVARALADAGFAVECPRLPGHGTAMDDMLATTWDDWAAEAAAALDRLRSRLAEGGRVVVAGLSVGGALTVWLATRNPDVAGIACVNPVAEPAGPLRDIVAAAVDEGTEIFPGIGSDIADPGAVELSYDGLPLRPLLTLLDAVDAFQPDLARVTCPLLLLSSPEDHVVPPSNSDHLAAAVAGPVERVSLDRSYHVATLDYDRGEVEKRIVDFALRVTGG